MSAHESGSGVGDLLSICLIRAGAKDPDNDDTSRLDVSRDIRNSKW